jgi:hypothetical protein
VTGFEVSEETSTTEIRVTMPRTHGRKKYIVQQEAKNVKIVVGESPQRKKDYVTACETNGY